MNVITQHQKNSFSENTNSHTEEQVSYMNINTPNLWLQQYPRSHC